VDGPAKRNQELSVLRARAVAKWLQENGVPSERIKGAIGYGSAMPKVPDPAPSVARKMTKQQLEAIREQNRRIELSILKDCE
ncbi:MAG: OmpA family protein, partial [Ignavibacteria bacterium]